MKMKENTVHIVGGICTEYLYRVTTDWLKSITAHFAVFMEKNMGKSEMFLLSLTIILSMLIITVSAFTFNPFDISNEISNTISNSSYAAREELQKDSTLIATCHMEFWRNQSHEIYTDASGIHKGSSEGGTLNYVCYYRDGNVIPTNIGYFNSHSDAFKFVFVKYNNYFNGNNGWVYNVN